jgi:hypothetical protein
MSNSALQPLRVDDGVRPRAPLDRTDVSLFVAIERSLEPDVARVLERVRTGRFANTINVCFVPEEFLRDVISVDTPVASIEVLLEEVMAGETGIVVQFVGPAPIHDELTKLQSGARRAQA